MMLERMQWSNAILLGALIGVCPWAAAQAIPDVTCTVEDYPVKAVVAWQFPQVQNAVQVVVLRDPSGKQEARFDLTHGASLLSLREEGKEMLFGQTAGASVSLFSVRTSPSPELKGMSPYWSAYSPDQGGSSMGIPATTTGVACEGQRTMRAFAVMQDRGSDSSFQKRALLGLEGGKISDNFPAGYSTPYVLETVASWVPNPGKTPEFYLKLDQTVVNTGPGPSGPLEWYLNVAAPWGDEHATSFPEKCTSKTPCTSREVKALATGRYADAGQTEGVAMVVPTAGWRADEAYVQPNAEYVVLLYNAVWAAPRRTFATVLRRPLDGVGAYHFSWYVCAGAWQAAKQFAQEQTAGDQEQPLTEPAMPANEPSKNPVAQACETTEFKPQPNQTDRAVVLRDPANEQTVLFDTSQGGAIVSLNYGGREHVWGYNGGGLLTDGLSQQHARRRLGRRLQPDAGRGRQRELAGDGDCLRREPQRNAGNDDAGLQPQQRLLCEATDCGVGRAGEHHAAAELLEPVCAGDAGGVGPEPGGRAAVLPATAATTGACRGRDHRPFRI